MFLLQFVCLFPFVSLSLGRISRKILDESSWNFSTRNNCFDFGVDSEFLCQQSLVGYCHYVHANSHVQSREGATHQLCFRRWSEADILQCVSASFERISMNFWTGAAWPKDQLFRFWWQSWSGSRSGVSKCRSESGSKNFLLSRGFGVGLLSLCWGHF